ncbi:MAG TPA: hypothetical protein VN153_13500, partial [Tahibacter sp.]|nr:hypothetical protein [Tahibacter sp.]
MITGNRLYRPPDASPWLTGIAQLAQQQSAAPATDDVADGISVFDSVGTAVRTRGRQPVTATYGIDPFEEAKRVVLRGRMAHRCAQSTTAAIGGKRSAAGQTDTVDFSAAAGRNPRRDRAPREC